MILLKSFTMKVMILKLAIIAIALVGQPGWTGTAFANSGANDPWLAEVQQQGISLEDAVAMVQAQTGGRILSAEAVNNDGRVVYRIKVLSPSGRVSVYHVDAATGQIL
ncbi:MAG TPA: hypothetical protein ENG78_07120 [Acidiferrobacteraceae bacterium]|nr:hypothetical protein [Acidiferrobacteraceae bacterium]HEX20571.1 hypothetical protein [Acidiferrobacteraceae bacterium]